MQKDARLALGRHWSECWADDIWLQAAAWFLNMDVHIIWAGEDTQGQTFSITDGNWSPVAEGDQRPRLYLGYIVGEHYQSLLPRVEDPLPKCVMLPAVDKTLKETLQNVLRAMEEAKSRQDTQVSSSIQFSFNHYTTPVHIDSRLLLQVEASAQHSLPAQNRSNDHEQVILLISTQLEGKQATSHSQFQFGTLVY